MRVYLLLFTVCVALICSCENNPHCTYDVDLPVDFVNKADTVSIGDTLYFESLFARDIPEKNHVDFIQLDEFNLFTQFGFEDISPNSMDHSGSQFEVLFLRGVFNQYSVGGGVGFGTWSFDHEFDGENYYLSIAVIPNEAGNFAFSMFSNFNVFVDDFEFRPSECRSEQIGVKFRMNEGDPEGNNFHLMQYALDSNYSDPDILDERRFIEAGYFAFVVEE